MCDGNKHYVKVLVCECGESSRPVADLKPAPTIGWLGEYVEKKAKDGLGLKAAMEKASRLAAAMPMWMKSVAPRSK